MSWKDNLIYILLSKDVLFSLIKTVLIVSMPRISLDDSLDIGIGKLFIESAIKL
jgi:hypothetical protein